MSTSDETSVVFLDDETRTDFGIALLAAIRVSDGAMGTRTSRAVAIASQLLAQNVITGLTIASLIDPNRKTNIPGISPSCKIFDLSSLCILTRGLIEAYLTLFYIAVQPVADDVREFRLLWWNWHEINERILGVEYIGSANPKLGIYKKRKNELRVKLSNHPAYASLPSKFRGAFEKMKPPRDALLMEKVKIAEASGIHPNQYRFVYKHCSEYAHAQPLAVSVLQGLSTTSPELPSLFRLTTRQATSFLLFTVRDFLTVFPQGQALVSREFLSLADFWGDIHKETQIQISPRFNCKLAALAGSGRAGRNSNPAPARPCGGRWPFAPSSRAVTKLVLFGICVRTLRLRDKISAT